MALPVVLEHGSCSPAQQPDALTPRATRQLNPASVAFVPGSAGRNIRTESSPSVHISPLSLSGLTSALSQLRLKDGSPTRPLTQLSHHSLKNSQSVPEAHKAAASNMDNPIESMRPEQSNSENFDGALQRQQSTDARRAAYSQGKARSRPITSSIRAFQALTLQNSHNLSQRPPPQV